MKKFLEVAYETLRGLGLLLLVLALMYEVTFGRADRETYRNVVAAEIGEFVADKEVVAVESNRTPTLFQRPVDLNITVVDEDGNTESRKFRKAYTGFTNTGDGEYHIAVCGNEVYVSSPLVEVTPLQEIQEWHSN